MQSIAGIVSALPHKALRLLPSRNDNLPRPNASMANRQ
jgi:hypothetical protein